ncbi:hypothetical protein [Acetobacterium sp.]|uniref:hypothetical protein n=1 Tax=Acetobacterium sp. TaxID=1872094 RepID=UPI000CC1136C|nr:hypothetical protein [Acetobacterium sp.]MDO9493542.1 hypothetical protein [Acetobacterium sp.]PKM71326.1 MAG: hypothetical protein CVU92_09010 [Firmicutes bacterium HGW-Firmicutes-17]
MLEDKLDMMEAEDSTEKKPFYYSKWWLVVWSLLIWPIGLIMLWGYFANMHKTEMPRTRLIKDNSEDL